MAKENHYKKSANGCMSLLRNLEHHQLLKLLSQGFCDHCQAHLEDRARNLFLTEKGGGDSAKGNADASWFSQNSERPNQQNIGPQDSIGTPELINVARKREYPGSPRPASPNNKSCSLQHSSSELLLDDGVGEDSSLIDDGLSEEEENARVSRMGWKDSFCCFERVDGRLTNVLEGLELYTRVFDVEEQKKIVEFVYKLQDKGRKNQLRGRTYSEPKKWMRGKGRVTIQFGCCYNYAVDKNGNPPGIIRDAEVEPLPPLFKQLIKRMVRWHVLPPKCVPDSCIVNIYEEGDCIPPHIDHHDFLRPFCTVSLLSDCNILFGSNLKVVGAGEFEGPKPVHLPTGSVLIFNGNGADIAKHCISAVSEKRISITFRKMDHRKRPYNFQSDPEMQRITPLFYPPVIKSHLSHDSQQRKYKSDKYSTNKYPKTVRKRIIHDKLFIVEKEHHFPSVRRVRVRY